MRRIRKLLITAVAGIAVISLSLGLAGCTDSGPVEITQQTTVIDVRTPAEFASGHLQGAINIDWEGDFEAGISQLPKDGTYLLYCRSGNRAGQAKSWMDGAGYTSVTNLGGYADASERTGLPIIQ